MGGCGSSTVEKDDGVDISKKAPTFEAKEVPTFVEGEFINIRSSRQASWMSGKISKKFLVGGHDGEYEVTAGTYKVIVLGDVLCKRYVRPEHLENLGKVTTCASCRRPAADTFTHCCRACEATRGLSHGPTCNKAYELPAPPVMRPEAPQEPREDAQEAAAGILPDDSVQWMWGDAGMGFLGHSLAQQNPLSWSPWSQLEATITDLAKVKDASRPVEVRTKRTMALQYFETVQKALFALRKQAQHFRDLRKVTTCASCRRPAADTFTHCCRTCEATRGLAHGPKCNAAYEALAPPAKSPTAPQVPREDAEAEAADILPDDTVQWMWGDAGMGFLGHSLAQQNPLSWSPWSQLEATINDLAKVEDARRPVEVRTKRTMALQYFDTVEKALLVLRKQAPSAPSSRLDPHTVEDLTRNERTHEGDYRCSIPGCSRPTWNGKAGEACCRTCKANGGRQHGLQCKQTYEAVSASPSRLDPHADEEGYRCISPGCSRPTWNGKAGEACCRTCKANGGKHHGLQCKQKYEAISASPPRLDPHAEEDMTRNESKHDGDHRCINPGCSRPTWDGKAGEVCCRTCKRSEGKQHGPQCNQKYDAVSASPSRL